MFLRQALASILHFFVVFIFLIAGLIFVLFPYLEEARANLIALLSHEMDQCRIIGVGCFAIAFLFLLGFYVLERGRYLVIRMGVVSDLRVIRRTIEHCFLEQFPKKIFLKDLQLKSKSELELKVYLSSLEKQEEEKLFSDVEKYVMVLLRERFGYTKPFYLTVDISK